MNRRAFARNMKLQFTKELSMSRITTAIKNDLQLLGLLHDEVKLQAHLLRADAKQRWDELEVKWSELQERVDRASVASHDARVEMDSAVKILADALRAGYESIRSALGSKAPR
jgi:hypothetical protein